MTMCNVHFQAMQYPTLLPAQVNQSHVRHLLRQCKSSILDTCTGVYHMLMAVQGVLGPQLFMHKS